MRPLKSNEVRAGVAINMIWIILGLQIISLISDYFQFELLQTVINGGEITMETADANDSRQQIIGILYFIAYGISGITFIRWFRRAYANLHTRVSYLNHDDGWAAGCWFIPIISFYRPFQIMKELYQETQLVLKKQLGKQLLSLSTSLLSWWWGLFLIETIIGQIVFRYSMNAETLDELMVVTVGTMVSSLIGIILALITVRVIKDYSSIEPMLFETRYKDLKESIIEAA